MPIIKPIVAGSLLGLASAAAIYAVAAPHPVPPPSVPIFPAVSQPTVTVPADCVPPAVLEGEVCVTTLSAAPSAQPTDFVAAGTTAEVVDYLPPPAPAPKPVANPRPVTHDDGDGEDHEHGEDRDHDGGGHDGGGDHDGGED